jgi:hypothetical protein
MLEPSLNVDGGERQTGLEVGPADASSARSHVGSPWPASWPQPVKTSATAPVVSSHS